ncbi:hypothetical protein LPB140_10015 [Sphingorhabdus lutea]|uniref:YdbS-like PH domain-containing protein n=1 Tax=Sphingorhabdus lutea TaxID=1913578 RepID=A0A1L3JF72_9SPHN|nr:hypothetical protein LPB140_10015 [Sphingorhabdus lutea]
MKGSYSRLTPLDPAYVNVLRLSFGLLALPILIGAGVLEFAELLPMGSIIIPVIFIIASLLWRLPMRKYRRWGYDMADDRLEIERGFLFYQNSIVPFSRVQHVDVGQGPIERIFGMAHLILYTAGQHNSHVTLPGLTRDQAEQMRDTARHYIRKANI